MQRSRTLSIAARHYISSRLHSVTSWACPLGRAPAAFSVNSFDSATGRSMSVYYKTSLFHGVPTMNTKHLHVRWGLVVLALGALLCVSSSVYAIPHLCCSDGDCCDAQYECPWECPEYDIVGLGICSGITQPCRFRHGCEYNWDTKCCTEAGGTPDPTCGAMAGTEEAPANSTNEPDANPGAPVGLIAILLALLAIPVVATRFASRR